MTKEILRRNPDDTDAIYDHSQSAYYFGLFYHNLKDFESALEYWEIYKRYAYDLRNSDPGNVDWIIELGWSENNVGNIYLNTEEYTYSITHFKLSVDAFDDALERSPQNTEIMLGLAYSLSGLAKSSDKDGQPDAAFKYRKKQDKLYDNLARSNPKNLNLAYDRLLLSMELYLSEIKDDRTDCSFLQASMKLDGFKRHLENDPENEQYRNANTYFRYHIFKICESHYTLEERIEEAIQLKTMIEKSSLENKTQFLGFVNQTLINQVQ